MAGKKIKQNQSNDNRRAGPFNILRRLTDTSTGMGDVYLAEIRDKYRSAHGLPRQVVLKVSKAKQDYEDRLRKESDMLRDGAHPNVVKIFPYPSSPKDRPSYVASHPVQNEYRFHYAMEYVGRRSVEELVSQQGRMKVRDVVEIGLDVARALEHIHQKQILNLDVKPSNVVMRDSSYWDCLAGRRSRAVLCDFGTARRFKDFAHEFGTNGYAPPEQLDERKGSPAKTDERSDIFSLGATLYCMLTGAPPHLESEHYKNGKTFPNIRAVNREVPDKLATVIHRCLEYDPRKRYQGAAELRQGLENLVPFYAPFARAVRCWIGSVGWILGIGLILLLVMTSLALVWPPIRPAAAAVLPGPVRTWMDTLVPGGLAVTPSPSPERPSNLGTPTLAPSSISNPTPTPILSTAVPSPAAGGAIPGSTRVSPPTPAPTRPPTNTPSSPTPTPPGSGITTRPPETMRIDIISPLPNSSWEPTIDQTIVWRINWDLEPGESFDVRVHQPPGDRYPLGIVEHAEIVRKMRRNGSEFSVQLRLAGAPSYVRYGNGAYILTIQLVKTSPRFSDGNVSRSVEFRLN